MSNLDHIRSLLTLLHLPGIGVVRAKKLIEHFGGAEKVLQADVKAWTEVDKIGAKTAQGMILPDYGYADKQLEKMLKYSAQVVSFWDEEYPAMLKEIYDPPLVLFYEGDLTVLKGDCFAIVGTRTPSQYGITMTKSISGGLAQRGFCIVSGMARGIDSEAHKAALAAEAATAAVLGCGIDVVYPQENSKLKKQITEKGVVLSEFPMGTSPEGQNFPRRNRIISGLSVGTLVAEAGLKSGALITAAYAVDQNREVFALPGDVTRSTSQGCNRLIKNQTAALASNADDILEALGKTVKEGKTLAVVKSQPELKGTQYTIYNILSLEPIYIDDLAQKVNLTTSEVLTVLLEMEMDGIVKSLPGKYYIRS